MAIALYLSKYWSTFNLNGNSFEGTGCALIVLPPKRVNSIKPIKTITCLMKQI
jgi:hypothetical protein